MKKAGIVIGAIVCVALLCGAFYYVKGHTSSGEDVELTKVQKIITRDMENDYPATPREVVKFYNRIITSYYDEEYTDQEFDALIDHAQSLFDAQLLEVNPKADYEASVRSEVADYTNRSRQICQNSVCDSDEVLYVTDNSNEDKLAYVTASYFVKEEKKYEKTYQMYVLRKDEEGKWKILTYYKIEGKTSEDEDDE